MTLASVVLPDRSCATCTSEKKQQWGCEKPTPIPMLFDGQSFDRCPVRPFLEDPAWFNEIWEAYLWAEKGYLPDGGTWQDQPLKLISLMNLVRQYMQEAQEAERAAREENSRRMAARAAKSPKGKSITKRPSRPGRRR